MTTTLSLDPRGRTSLAKITEHRLFTVVVEEGGRIILDPAVVVSAQSLYDTRPDVRAEIAAGEAGPSTIRPRPTR